MPTESKHWVLYRGTNPFKKSGEFFESHGLKFVSKHVYNVSPEVFEYVKAMKGFEVLDGIDSQRNIEFPKTRYVETKPTKKLK